MKKAVVTGANGFVGTALCRELSRRGVKVIAVVRGGESDVSGIRDLSGLRIIYCDMSRYGELGQLLSERDVDVFYHLAWEGAAGSMRGDESVQLRNVQYSCDALRGCYELQCKRFVFASSIMEYEVNALMEKETTPPVTSLYSSAKVAANQMLRTLAASLGIEYIRGVISNIYGPGEKNPRLINASIRKMLRREHCSFSPGEQMYDFIYIDDAAGAFYAIGERGRANRTYYIGSQQPRPLRDFLLEMAHQVDPSLEIGLGELPFHGVSLTYREFDIHGVMNDTGFVPKVDFAEGIRRTVEWIKREEMA